MWSIGTAALGLILAASSPVVAGEDRRTCVVKGGGNNATDDAPAIIKAFQDCGKHGKVVLEPTTYYVNSVMNISGLEDVYVDWRGVVLVSILQSFKRHFSSLFFPNIFFSVPVLNPSHLADDFTSFYRLTSGVRILCTG